MPFVRVAEIGEIPAHEPFVARLPGQRLALVRLGGEVFAFDDACPHNLGPLGLGEVADGVLTCPLHGWQFDVRSGACRTAAGERATRHAVRVEGTTVYVDTEPEP